MDLEILEYETRPCKFRIGFALVKYHQLVIKCDLVYFPKGKKAWVRMPEKWFTPTKKTSFCYWPTKEISDQFQKEVLKLIFDKYDLNEDKIAALHGKNV